MPVMFVNALSTGTNGGLHPNDGGGGDLTGTADYVGDTGAGISDSSPKSTRCTETTLTNVVTRSPEMAPRLVYRNKKYGRKSCPINQRETNLDSSDATMKTIEQNSFLWNLECPTIRPASASNQDPPSPAEDSPPRHSELMSRYEEEGEDVDDVVLGGGGGGGGGGGRAVTCDIFSSSPPDSSRRISIDLSSRENLWVSELAYQDKPLSIISVGQSSSLGSEPSKAVDYTVFTALDPHETGQTTVSSILDYWDCLGISNPTEVLSDLGLDKERSHVDLRHVTYLLIEELNQSQDILRYSTLWAGLQTLLSEIKVLKSILENLNRERDKLRTDLQETNQRLSILIKEGDEQNERQEQETIRKIQLLESRCEEYIKEVEQKANEDKEANLNLVKKLKKELSQSSNLQREEKEKFNVEVEKLRKEIENLNSENVRLSSRLKERTTEYSNAVNKSNNLNSGCDEIYNNKTENITIIEEELHRLAVSNKELKDKNDELQLLLQSRTHHNDRVDTSNIQIIPVCGPDLKENVSQIKVPIKNKSENFNNRKNSNLRNVISDLLKSPAPVPTTGPASLPLYTNKNRQRSGGQVVQLEEHCKHLEGKLDQVKFEIMRVLSEREWYCKENEVLRQYREAYIQLQREINPSHRKGLEISDEIPLMTHPLDSSSPPSTVNMDNRPSFHQEILCNPNEIDRSSPDGQEFDLVPLGKETLHEQIVQLERRNADLLKENKQLKAESSRQEQLILQLQQETSRMETKHHQMEEAKEDVENRVKQMETEKMEEVSKYKKEILSYKKKIEELEESLDLIRVEFESMEDYWQHKLDEERKFYENQLRKSEEQFQEFEGRMKEYETMYGGVKKEHDEDDDDRLSTIDESSSMEQQVTEWEQEILQLRSQLDRIEDTNSEEVEKIEEEWRLKLEKLEEEWRLKVESLQEELSKHKEQVQTNQMERSAAEESEENHDVWNVYTVRKDGLTSSFQNKPTFIPHTPRQGPSSLPVDLVNTAQREVRRLQDLRRIIQEECDHLLLRKERLKEEVCQSKWPSSPSWRSGQSQQLGITTADEYAELMSLLEDNGFSDLPDPRLLKSKAWSSDMLVVGFNNGKASGGDGVHAAGQPPAADKQLHGDQPAALCSSSSFSSSPADKVLAPADAAHQKDAWTQVPCWNEIENHTDTLSSLAMGYKVLLMDLQREKKMLEQSINSSSSSPSPSNQEINPINLCVSIHADAGIYNCLQTRIDQQKTRCRQLQTALIQQKNQTKQILETSREQHQSEVEQLEGLVTAAQDLVAKQTKKYTQQLEKLSLAHNLISQLLSENDTLMTALIALQSGSGKQSEPSSISREQRCGQYVLQVEEI